jgi:NADH-quinone oxidoreductase subunit L
MGSSILACLLGIALAFYLYRLQPGIPGRIAQRFGTLYRLLLNKYYIDELYISAIVKPTLAFSRGVILKMVDIACIEGVVNGLPRSIGNGSQRLRKIQDGQVSHYLAWMGGGALVVLVVLLIKG